MSALVRGLVVVGILVVPGVASANGLGLRATHSYYYYPAYYCAYPTYRIIYAEPAPAYQCVEEKASPAASGAPRNFAQPRPAGPSVQPATPKSTAEPPRSAGVSESRYFSAYPVAPRTADRPANDRVRVGFWNLTDRDVTLIIGQQAYPLARGKNVNVDVARTFVWRIDQREPQNETVPNKEAALEIVIRR